MCNQVQAKYCDKGTQNALKEKASSLLQQSWRVCGPFWDVIWGPRLASSGVWGFHICIWDSSMLLGLLVVHSFLELNNIPLYEYILVLSMLFDNSKNREALTTRRYVFACLDEINRTILAFIPFYLTNFKWVLLEAIYYASYENKKLCKSLAFPLSYRFPGMRKSVVPIGWKANDFKQPA